MSFIQLVIMQLRIFLLVTFITLLSFELNNAVTFKLTNVVCKSYNESWFRIHKCRLKAVKRDRTVFNFNGTVMHSANDIFVHGRMFKRANGYKPWLLNIFLDGCKFIKHRGNPVARVIANLFLDFTNFNHTCPYVGSQIIDGFYLRPELLVLPIPTGDYQLTLGWYFDKRLQFDTNVSFQFVENIIDQ